MQKKGIELSLNTVIIASIGLLILVLLAFLVVNYVKNLREGTETCNAKGGLCQTATCTNEITPATGKTLDCSSNTNGNLHCCPVVGG